MSLPEGRPVVSAGKLGRVRSGSQPSCRAARAARCTVSAYLRANAVGAPAAAKPRKIKLVRHPVSGLLYDVSGKDLPKVSNEEVKAMLADFP